jgi:phosphoglycolate phosphatase-like HAD superfamily hydrolase
MGIGSEAPLTTADGLAGWPLESRLGAPAGGVLGGPSIDALLEALLQATPPGRIILPTSLVATWAPRLQALGRPWTQLHIEGQSALDTLMDAVTDAQPGDQVWLNLCRQPRLDLLDLHSLEAFLPFAASRPQPPLVVLMRDDAPELLRTQRLAVDRSGNVLLLREIPGAAYALGQPELLAQLAAAGGSGPVGPLPPVRGRGQLLVLDVDGVLIDPGRSFHEAVAAALAELAPGLAWDDGLFAAFKRVGGFNNDFRLTAGAMALFEAGELDRLPAAEGIGFPHLEARIRELEPLCQAVVQKHYARTRRLERPLVNLQDLQAFKGDLAIFTGRPPEELIMAFEVLKFRLPAMSDSAPHLRKPRPEGLLQLADGYRSARVVFVGDTCDDAAALAAARALNPGVEWVFAGVGPERERFTGAGDLSAASLKDLMPQLQAGSPR